MSSETEFSTTRLLTLLGQIKESIDKEELPVDVQEDIWNSIFWNKNDPQNKELTKYLITGWWVHQNLNQD